MTDALGSDSDDVFTDAAGRRIDLREYGFGPVADEFEALVGMYRSFDPRYRSDGIPPVAESAVRTWVARISRDRCTVAWHGTRPAGQAVLVRDASGGYELAVFVHQDYQRAGIGGRLVEALLRAGSGAGVGRVWLLTTSDNGAMLALARRNGFGPGRAASGQVLFSRDVGAQTADA